LGGAFAEAARLARVCRAFANEADARVVSRPDETFIVRVRPEEGDAVVEQPRLSRRRQISDVRQVGPLIVRWLRLAESDAGTNAHRRKGSTR
jgi:hypothetical protein